MYVPRQLINQSNANVPQPSFPHWDDILSLLLFLLAGPIQGFVTPSNVCLLPLPEMLAVKWAWHKPGSYWHRPRGSLGSLLPIMPLGLMQSPHCANLGPLGLGRITSPAYGGTRQPFTHLPEKGNNLLLFLLGSHAYTASSSGSVKTFPGLA